MQGRQQSTAETDGTTLKVHEMQVVLPVTGGLLIRIMLPLMTLRDMILNSIYKAFRQTVLAVLGQLLSSAGATHRTRMPALTFANPRAPKPLRAGRVPGLPHRRAIQRRFGALASKGKCGVAW